MKNVYAIALGVADGLQEAHGRPYHDLKAATFAQAVRELVVLTELLGGRAATATGLAGVGDLEVTGLSGRNKVYGQRLGRGEPAADALAAMAAAEQTVEGVPAARLARLENLRRVPRAALVVDDYDDDWSRLRWVMVRGPVAFLDEPAAHATALALLRRRYPQYRQMHLDDPRAHPVVRLAPERVNVWSAT